VARCKLKICPAISKAPTTTTTKNKIKKRFAVSVRQSFVQIQVEVIYLGRRQSALLLCG
jgi:hypothetical protein